MTVSSTIARAQYTGTGSTGPFAFNFKLFDTSHIKVVKTSTSGVDTTLTLTTDYSVSLAADFSSATVTLVSALASGELLTLLRNPPQSQAISWPANDPFPSATHERAADLAVMLIQALSEQIGRSILLPDSSDLSGLSIPSPVANYALGWNATADDLTNVGVPTVYAQASAPIGVIILNSLWIDSDSTDLDLYQYNGTTWVDTTVNLKGATGATGATGAAGSDGVFSGTETTVTITRDDNIPIYDTSDSNNPKKGLASDIGAGKQTIWIPASGMLLATTNGPAIAQIEYSNGNNYAVLDFDGATRENALFSIAFPKGYDGNALSYQVYWTTTGSDTDAVVWGLEAVNINDNSGLNVAYTGSAATVTDNIQSVADALLVSAETSMTPRFSFSDGRVTNFRLYRDAANVNDTVAEDARLIGIRLFYTTNANTDD